jgi:hypothetical protein
MQSLRAAKWSKHPSDDYSARTRLICGAYWVTFWALATCPWCTGAAVAEAERLPGNEPKRR